jgi:hypothetical protein
MWIRRAGPLSIILKVQRIILMDTCVSILLSMMLTLTLYPVYRAAQDYTGALFDRLHSMSPDIGSVITEVDMIINQTEPFQGHPTHKADARPVDRSRWDQAIQL